MIKISGNTTPIVRETKAPFEYVENGELKTAQIRVRYFGKTVKELREFQAQLKERDPEEIIWVSESLMKRLESLPDLIGDDGFPVSVTLEFLETVDLKNLKAIEKAIQEADNPK